MIVYSLFTFKQDYHLMQFLFPFVDLAENVICSWLAYSNGLVSHAHLRLLLIMLQLIVPIFEKWALAFQSCQRMISNFCSSKKKLGEEMIKQLLNSVIVTHFAVIKNIVICQLYLNCYCQNMIVKWTSADDVHYPTVLKRKRDPLFTDLAVFLFASITQESIFKSSNLL